MERREPDLPRIVGRFNDIHKTARIADTARICGWCYIGPEVEIGENTVIGNLCEINSGAKIGRDTLLNSHCHLNSNTGVGDRVILGSGVLTADEKYMTAITARITKKPCVIGDGCRIGQNSSLICTRLGDHVSIGAGSVVLEPEIKPFQVWAGVPARFIREMTDYEIDIGSSDGDSDIPG